jgi:hypothetical protein
MTAISGSYSGERAAKAKNQNPNTAVSQFMTSAPNDENSNSINIQNMRTHANMDQNQMKLYPRQMVNNGQGQQH